MVILPLALAPTPAVAVPDRQVLLIVVSDLAYADALDDPTVSELAGAGGLGLMTTSGGAGDPTRTAVNVGAGGAFAFVDQVSGTSTTTISVGSTVNWVWVSGFHSTTSGTCPTSCTPDGIWDSGVGSGMTFSHTFPQAGTFPYFCLSHGAMMQGTVIVQ